MTIFPHLRCILSPGAEVSWLWLALPSVFPLCFYFFFFVLRVVFFLWSTKVRIKYFDSSPAKYRDAFLALHNPFFVNGSIFYNVPSIPFCFMTFCIHTWQHVFWGITISLKIHYYLKIHCFEETLLATQCQSTLCRGCWQAGGHQTCGKETTSVKKYTGKKAMFISFLILQHYITKVL